MHLKAIRIRGFKSFPDPVEVRLERGVAVVVGPNGSGKSNIADAMRWAAGTLSPHELRAEKPDDVLFSGTATRKASDHCEVELLLDNSDGQLPVDFTEVSIIRRLHRGGEGQYLVNHTPVRRLDLTELLADVGLGGHMGSIIGQGKVEAVLASKPADRRALVEEAAGLGKFKSRRHRAELKLARVGQQVERARDVEAEVTKRLRPLALQATAAERAEKLLVEIAGLKALLASRDLASVKERLGAAGERRAAAAQVRAGVTGRLESLLKTRADTEESLGSAAAGGEEATAALYRLRGAAERVALRKETAEQLLETMRRDVELARDEASAPQTGDLEEVALAARAAAGTAVTDHAAASERSRAAHHALAAAERASLAVAQEKLQALHVERRGVEDELGDAAGRREAATQALYQLRGARDRVQVRRESVVPLVERWRSELREAEELAALPGPTPDELEASANEASAAARAAASERDSLRDRARSARERLAALESSIAQREGLPPAARALAEAGERLALSLLDVDPGYERAVAAALSWRASALVANDPAAALALLERARESGLGSLAVVVPRGTPAASAPPVTGARPFADLARGDAAALALLDGVWLVERERLLEARHGIAITAEGHGFDADRGELWFAGETAEAVLLELDNRRRDLTVEAEQLATAAEAAQAAAATTAEAAKAAEAAYAEAAPRRRTGLADAGVLARLVAGGERLEQTLIASIAAAGGFDEPLQQQAEAGAARATELGDRLRGLSEGEAAARAQANEAGERLRRAEVELQRLGAEGGDELALPADIDSLRAETFAASAAERHAAQLAAEAAARARAAEDSLAETLRRPQVDLVRLVRTAGAAERLVAALLTATQVAARHDGPLAARVESGTARAGALAAELRRLAEEEATQRRAAYAAAEASSQIEIEIARLDAEADDARRRLAEAAVDPTGDPDAPATRPELVERLERLERRRESLGAVNPLAQEEYEAEKLRLQELAVQREDLEKSLAELEDLRKELTETVERRFEETFAAVATHFEEIAGTLFPGGTGRLRLTEPEDEGEEPGIEVELQPAGKRVTRLSLLSGGEKSLGALSFLFALFLARPHPFYLLDEVEAALDDTNIGRFVDLLRSYATKAQFIVITHQKRTMQAADILYGVTMGSNGISQVVSRRMPADAGTTPVAPA